jgi:hypothetical protein
MALIFVVTNCICYCFACPYVRKFDNYLKSFEPSFAHKITEPSCRFPSQLVDPIMIEKQESARCNTVCVCDKR